MKIRRETTVHLEMPVEEYDELAAVLRDYQRVLTTRIGSPYETGRIPATGEYVAKVDRLVKGVSG